MKFYIVTLDVFFFIVLVNIYILFALIISFVLERFFHASLFFDRLRDEVTQKGADDIRMGQMGIYIILNILIAIYLLTKPGLPNMNKFEYSLLYKFYSFFVWVVLLTLFSKLFSYIYSKFQVIIDEAENKPELP
ncbi:MAG: hypothetical protein ISR95_09225 [Candidatus Marinimicrobia bacterium]|nr:hypothetical protein [Candidatus Neomarinimicrobiota bacterium]